MNDERAALFNLIIARLRSAEPLPWLFASTALVVTARLARASPKSPVDQLIRQAVDEALDAVITARLEVLGDVPQRLLEFSTAALKAAGEAGPLVVLPALRRAASPGQEALPIQVVALRSLRGAMLELKVSYDAAAFDDLEAQLSLGAGTKR